MSASPSAIVATATASGTRCCARFRLVNQRFLGCGPSLTLVRTSQAGAPTSDNHNGAFAVTASVVCNFTALDCLGVPALSLTDDEQSPSWWCPGLTAHIQDALNCAANMAIENRFGSDCPRNGRTPL